MEPLHTDTTFAEAGACASGGCEPWAASGEDAGRCGAFRAAMEILGRPWNGVLLRALEPGPRRFSALGDALGIGDRMLSCRLKELEAAGLVDRLVDPGPPVRVSYTLTPVGRGLGAVILSIEAWGAALLAARPVGSSVDGGVCPAEPALEAPSDARD